MSVLRKVKSKGEQLALLKKSLYEFLMQFAHMVKGDLFKKYVGFGMQINIVHFPI